MWRKVREGGAPVEKRHGRQEITTSARPALGPTLAPRCPSGDRRGRRVPRLRQLQSPQYPPAQGLLLGALAEIDAPAELLNDGQLVGLDELDEGAVGVLAVGEAPGGLAHVEALAGVDGEGRLVFCRKATQLFPQSGRLRKILVASAAG